MPRGAARRKKKEKKKRIGKALQNSTGRNSAGTTYTDPTQPPSLASVAHWLDPRGSQRARRSMDVIHAGQPPGPQDGEGWRKQSGN